MQKLQLRKVVWSCLLAISALQLQHASAQEFQRFERTAAVDWRSTYRQAVDEANRDGKPLLVCVTASWCGPCRQMKQLTFTDTRIIDAVRSGFVPCMIDADEHPELVSGLGIEAYPTTLVIAPDLAILKRMSGFQSASDLVVVLNSMSTSKSLASSSGSTATRDEAVSALSPANVTTFGFDGYCLVSILEESRVLRGSSEFVAEHRGEKICFQTEEHRQKFLRDPEKYWPVANGQCLVSSREGANVGKGDPRMAVTWRGRIWLFSDRERQQRFIQMPLYYVQ